MTALTVAISHDAADIVDVFLLGWAEWKIKIKILKSNKPTFLRVSVKEYNLVTWKYHHKPFRNIKLEFNLKHIQFTSPYKNIIFFLNVLHITVQFGFTCFIRKKLLTLICFILFTAK